MSFIGILKRLREMWVESLIGLVCSGVIGFSIFWSVWVSFVFTVVVSGLFFWYYTTAWKGEI